QGGLTQPLKRGNWPIGDYDFAGWSRTRVQRLIVGGVFAHYRHRSSGQSPRIDAGSELSRAILLVEAAGATAALRPLCAGLVRRLVGLETTAALLGAGSLVARLLAARATIVIGW